MTSVSSQSSWARLPGASTKRTDRACEPRPRRGPLSLSSCSPSSARCHDWRWTYWATCASAFTLPQCAQSPSRCGHDRAAPCRCLTRLFVRSLDAPRARRRMQWRNVIATVNEPTHVTVQDIVAEVSHAGKEARGRGGGEGRVEEEGERQEERAAEESTGRHELTCGHARSVPLDDAGVPPSPSPRLPPLLLSHRSVRGVRQPSDGTKGPQHSS